MGLWGFNCCSHFSLSWLVSGAHVLLVATKLLYALFLGTRLQGALVSMPCACCGWWGLQKKPNEKIRVIISICLIIRFVFLSVATPKKWTQLSQHLTPLCTDHHPPHRHSMDYCGGYLHTIQNKAIPGVQSVFSGPHHHYHRIVLTFDWLISSDSSDSEKPSMINSSSTNSRRESDRQTSSWPIRIWRTDEGRRDNNS